MTATAVLDPEIQVRDLSNPEVFTTWNISQNLTDRWGDINDAEAEKKPLDELRNTPGLLDRLVNQMESEFTFVVRKDGRFGILFEEEYCTKESERDNGVKEEEWRHYKPHAELLQILVKVVKGLQVRFPTGEWAIPHEDEVWNGRLAIWGFFPDGSLTEQEREEVLDAILEA